MSYYHVIAKIGKDENFHILFTDLTVEELSKNFVTPYKKNNPFFSGNDLIQPNDLQSIQVIRTERPNEDERNEINRKSQEHINRINDSYGDIFLVSPGRGYSPQDIAEVGEDVTKTFIKEPPGFKARSSEPLMKILAWVAGIIATVFTAGIVKWLGWL